MGTDQQCVGLKNIRDGARGHFLWQVPWHPLSPGAAGLTRVWGDSSRPGPTEGAASACSAPLPACPGCPGALGCGGWAGCRCMAGAGHGPPAGFAGPPPRPLHGCICLFPPQGEGLHQLREALKILAERVLILETMIGLYGE